MSKAQFNFHARAKALLKAKHDYDTFMAGPMHRLRTYGLTPEVRAEWDVLVETPEYKNLLKVWAMATDAVTTPEFWDLYQRLRTRTDPEALEHAIAFLEADPYFYRSGYIKQKMLRFIRGYQLLPDDKIRLQRVLLYIVDTHYCYEFRDYCRLAPKVTDDAFRKELESRLKSGQSGIRNRAKWILDCLNGKYTGSWTRNQD